MIRKITFCFMKNLGFVAVFFIQLGFAQKTDSKDFQKIPGVFEKAANSYPFITPNQDYDYWKVFTNDPDSEKAILYESQTPEPMTILEPAPKKGFFQKCLGENCFHYIIACKNDKTKYFNTEQELVKFIGTVDNIGEAVLVANTHSFYVDSENFQAGSFRKDDDFFYLNTFRPERCDDVREKYFVTINRKNAKIKFERQGIYTEKKTCN